MSEPSSHLKMRLRLHAQSDKLKLIEHRLYLALPSALQSIPNGRALSRRKVVPKLFLFILDSLGSSELLVILGAALIFFGPRRLPQLSRQIGKSRAEFRRASEDFKRTWEREVNLENVEKGVEPKEENSILDRAAERIRAAREVAAFGTETPAAAVVTPPSVTPVDRSEE